MLRYARIDGQKVPPFAGGRGTCDCCGGLLVAKCGQIVTHHWAHDKRADCNTWSEQIGTWHLWWQNLVKPEAVEVVLAPHRADIVGNDGIVIELQHSPISVADIEAREAFYGDMVWLFDATTRFTYTDHGERAFFSLGTTKHLERCKKPVFLDFGYAVLEVTQFTSAITKVSGYGIIRKREWFAQTFLSKVKVAGANPNEEFKIEVGGRDPWASSGPVKKLRHATRWYGKDGIIITLPKWTSYIKVDIGYSKPGERTVWDYENVIQNHPEIANGWDKKEFERLLVALSGKAIIIQGNLCILPSPTESMMANMSVAVVNSHLMMADRHILAGRVPILKDTTKEFLLNRAKQFDQSRGWSPKMPPETKAKAPSPEQKSIFDMAGDNEPETTNSSPHDSQSHPYD